MVLEVKNIDKSFREHFWSKGVKALDDVSFCLDEGELIGFLGANGAGKTTTLKIILGFVTANKGSVNYGTELGSGRGIFKNIGYMPERPYYYPYLTGHEFLSYCGNLQEMSEIEIKEQSLYWAKKLKIDHALDRKLNSYSKGMLQRIGFTSVLIHNPKLIILDEPLSGLDPVGRKEFKDILVELNDMGKTVFFSSHIVSDVEEICKKVVVLEKGKMIYEGSIDKLVEDNVKALYRISTEENENFRESHQDSFKYSNGELDIYEVSLNAKDSFVKEIIDAKVPIYHLAQDKVTLEEVIYNLRD